MRLSKVLEMNKIIIFIDKCYDTAIQNRLYGFLPSIP